VVTFQRKATVFSYPSSEGKTNNPPSEVSMLLPGVQQTVLEQSLCLVAGVTL
jgi:hypothetical protein